MAGHAALLPMSLGQEASPAHRLSTQSQNSLERRSNWPGLRELPVPGSAVHQGTGLCSPNMVARASSQGNEIVSRKDTSKMSMTFILDLLKCTFLGLHQTLYKPPWGFSCTVKFKNRQVWILLKHHYTNSNCHHLLFIKLAFKSLYT